MFCRKIVLLQYAEIHHKTIRVIYQSDESYKNLHDLDNSVSIH